MGNLMQALVLVFVLTGLMYLTQTAILQINPSAAEFFHEKGTVYDTFNKGNYTHPTLDTERGVNDLPDSKSGEASSSGDVFTDAFSTLRGWIFERTGIAYVMSILAAPYSLLRYAGIPDSIRFVLGSLWYGIIFLSIIAFMVGRDT